MSLTEVKNLTSRTLPTEEEAFAEDQVFHTSDDSETTPIDPTLPLLIWERYPNESENYYSYFRMYVESAYPEGPSGRFAPRSLTKLAKQFGIQRKFVSQLCVRYHWATRAGAWDRHIDRQRADATLDHVERMHKRHLRRLAKLGSLAEMELDKLLERAQSADVSHLTAGEILKMLDFTQRSERLMQGEATEHVRVDTDWNLEALDLNDLKDLARIRKKASSSLSEE